MTANATDRDLLKRVYGELGDRTLSGDMRRITAGDRLVAVEIDGAAGHRMGVAHRPPGEIGGKLPDDVLALSRWAFDPPGDDPVAAALGVAALNARSDGSIPWNEGDPMAALDPDVDCIATVGLFRAAFRKFEAVDVRVIEREPVGAIDAPSGVSVSVFGPEDADEAIADVDVLFVTGSSLVYGGTVDYLRSAAAVPTVILIGATSSFLPGPAFDAGTSVVAGARVIDPDRVRAGIAAGLCGTDLHDRGLEKVYVAAESALPGIELDADGQRGATDRD